MRPPATPRSKAPAPNAPGLGVAEQGCPVWLVALPAFAGIATLGSYLLADFFMR